MSLSHLSDLELVAGFQDLVIDERENLVIQLEHIAELDRRKLFFDCSSLWAFLVSEQGMEEWIAERKIRAARMLRRFPEIRGRLESGKLNVTLLELTLGCAHREKLSESELWELIEAISGKSCKAARREIAARFPQDVPEIWDQVRPITGELSEVRFVADQALLEKLDEIRGLLAHSHPKATLAELIGVLADEYYERHHPEPKARRAQERAERVEPAVARAKAESESPTSPRATERRTPPQSMSHELTLRDGYRCSFVDETTQKQCSSRFALEEDHREAWSDGGKTELSNLRYLCRNHHRRVTFQQFGEWRGVERPGRTRRADVVLKQ